MLRIFLFIIAALCAGAAAAETPGTAPTTAPPAGEIAVTEAEFGREARITVDGCAAALAYRPDQAAMVYRDGCKRPLADKLGLVARLAEAALGDGDPPPRLSVFTGRIVQTFPDLAAELATAAAGTSSWNPDVVRRSATAANASVVQLLAATDGGRAIRTADMPAGYAVSGIAVEKVLTALPRQLPFPLPAQIVGSSGDTQLPFDAMLWVVLARS